MTDARARIVCLGAGRMGRGIAVAFAYAEMSAAYERYAASELEHVPDEQIEVDVELTERHFIDLSDRLHDSGMNGIVVQAWERESQRSSVRMLH